MATEVQEVQDPRLVKIGELLIGVGAMTTGDLTEAIQISRRMGVPIGRVLVMSGCVNESNLQQALELQSLIKDGLVEREVGEQALQLVFNEKIDLQTALKRLNWQPKANQAGNKLGDLLVDSMIVTRSQLERALETSFQSGMPLGGTLVLQGVLSAQLLPTVLHIQDKIRENQTDRQEAIEELKRALMFWARADQSKSETLAGESESPAPPAPAPAAVPAANTAGAEKPARKQPIFESGRPTSSTGTYATTPGKTNEVSLVELLKLSNFCTQATLDAAVEKALSDSRLASKVLLSIGFIDSDSLNQYVHVQALIARGKLRTDQALYVLNSMKHRQVSLEQALGELGIRAT